ncbi:MAG: DUF2807 domain-containing protein [Bacteroidota bacterium]
MRSVLFIAALFLTQLAFAQAETVELSTFSKVIISPKIEAKFIPSETSKVVIIDSDVPEADLNVVVKGNTLKVYIDDHKFFPKQQRQAINNGKMTTDLYEDDAVEIIVYYEQLEKVVIRGDNDIIFKDQLQADKLTIKQFGDNDIRIDDLRANELKVVLYGDSEFKVYSGQVTRQRYRTYGDTDIDVDRLQSKTARFRSYGDADAEVQADERIKLFALGDQSLRYSGTAKLRKTLVLGNTSIRKRGGLTKMYR